MGQSRRLQPESPRYYSFIDLLTFYFRISISPSRHYASRMSMFVSRSLDLFPEGNALQSKLKDCSNHWSKAPPDIYGPCHLSIPHSICCVVLICKDNQGSHQVQLPNGCPVRLTLHMLV